MFLSPGFSLRLGQAEESCAWFPTVYSFYNSIRAYFFEYREVLHRPKLEFDKNTVDIVLDFITQNGQVVAAGTLKRRLPDVDDEPFLEVAIAGNASCLVSGNKVYFPRQAREGMKVLSPGEFIEFFRESDKGPLERFLEEE